jgi:hypothetical protein
VFGAHMNAEAISRGKPSAKWDARESIGTVKSAALQRPDSSGIIVCVQVWKKLSAFNRKQKTCRRKNHLSRTTPLTRPFLALERSLAKASAQELRRWRQRSNSAARQSERERSWIPRSKIGLPRIPKVFLSNLSDLSLW